MTIKASVFIATSLDGFIVREDGNLDWLLGATTSTDDHGYAAYIATVDAIVVGRNTFEKALTFGEWPYTGKRVIVLSTSLTKEDIPVALIQKVELYAGPVSRLVKFLAASGSSNIYVDGGKVVQSFIKEGLINEITITRIPVLIGAGIPLFGSLDRDIRLQHLETKSFDSGFVQSTYRINT
jgi:dihydrofolate reductase